ncbi:MAG: hypothetical protein ACREV4_16740 [Gammaproteobacteria bacterium]
MVKWKSQPDGRSLSGSASIRNAREEICRQKRSFGKCGINVLAPQNATPKAR